jgi:CheY-like chemotaxis protein
VLPYISSRQALAHLAEAGAGGPLPHFIFLDINMPVVDGWLFMDEFVRLKPAFGQVPRVFIVSSSIDPRDMQRAADHPDIEGYIEKPISPDKYREILVRS